MAKPEDIPRWEVALAAVEQAEAAGDPTTKARLAGPATRDPGRAGRGPARQGPARSPGRHPLGRGRRPGRLDHRRRLRRRLPRGRDRSGQPAAGRGGGEDQGPAAIRGAGAGQRHSTTGRRSAAGSGQDAAGAAQTERGRPHRRPRPLAQRAAHRPGPSRQGGPADRACRPWRKTAKYRRTGADQPALAGDRSERRRRQPDDWAESVLRKAQQRHPRDVWVNYALGRVLEKLSRRDEAIRFYTAARSIRPETAHELAHALAKRGDSDEAHRRVPRSQGARPAIARHSVPGRARERVGPEHSRASGRSK